MKFMKNVSKKFIIATTVALGLGTVVPLINTTSAASGQEKRIVIDTYYLSKQQVKDMAANAEALKTFSNASHTLSKIVKVPAAKVAILAAGMSASAAYRQEFVDAAKKNQRVKVIVTDYANYHTSYSTQLQLIPVN